MKDPIEHILTSNEEDEKKIWVSSLLPFFLSSFSRSLLHGDFISHDNFEFHCCSHFDFFFLFVLSFYDVCTLKIELIDHFAQHVNFCKTEQP